MPEAKVVLLILSIWNSDTGTLLHREMKMMPDFSIRNNPIEDCRVEGVARGKQLVRQFLPKYHSVFANVDCKWMSRSEYQDL